jgi:hypothetical protein
VHYLLIFFILANILFFIASRSSKGNCIPVSIYAIEMAKSTISSLMGLIQFSIQVIPKNKENQY